MTPPPACAPAAPGPHTGWHACMPAWAHADTPASHRIASCASPPIFKAGGALAATARALSYTSLPRGTLYLIATKQLLLLSIL